MVHLGQDIAAYVDGQLSPEAASKADEHFAKCDRCRRSLEHQRALKARIVGTGNPAPPPTLLASLEDVPTSPVHSYSLLPSAIGAAMVLVGASLVVVAAAYALAPSTRAADPVRPAFDRFATLASSVSTPRRHLSSADMDELDESGWPSERSLGPGFVRVDGHLHENHEVVAQVYVGHGQSVLLFEQVGTLDDDAMKSFERHLISDRLVWVREGEPRIVTWDSDGMVYTVVSNLPDQHLGQLLADLPAPPSDPTVLDRVRSGLVRMSSWP
jgi:anti-sigma factor RsiW